jgi:hypothetical protein
MMKIKIAVIALVWLLLLGNLSTQAQQPRTVEFAKLSDYVSDSDHRRDGERLIVINVPLTGEVKYDKLNKIYFFTAEDSDGVREIFYASPELAKTLRQRLNSGYEWSERVYCTLVQFVSSQDVYRAPFMTKVEGFDGHETHVWTVVGPQPVKLKLQG